MLRASGEHCVLSSWPCARCPAQSFSSRFRRAAGRQRDPYFAPVCRMSILSNSSRRQHICFATRPEWHIRHDLHLVVGLSTCSPLRVHAGRKALARPSVNTRPACLRRLARHKARLAHSTATQSDTTGSTFGAIQQYSPPRTKNSGARAALRAPCISHASDHRPGDLLQSRLHRAHHGLSDACDKHLAFSLLCRPGAETEHRYTHAGPSVTWLI